MSSSPESIATFVGAPGRPALAGARPAARGACATAAPTRCTRSARTTRALGGLHPRAVRDLAARAGRQRRAGARSTRRAGWWTWRAATAASRWRCAAATPASRRRCSTCRRAPRSGREIVAEQGFADRVSFREGDVFELGLGERARRRLGLQPDPPPARGARPRAVPDGARGAAAGRRARDRRLGAARAGRAGVRARRDLEPALLRLEPQPQLHAVGDARLDGGGRLRGRRGAPQRALALARWW